MAIYATWQWRHSPQLYNFCMFPLKRGLKKTNGNVFSEWLKILTTGYLHGATNK